MEKYSQFVLVVLFLAITDNFGFFCQANPNVRCRADEREALLIFKAELEDPSNRLTSWAGEDCCRWQGVRCHNITGHVIRLSLQNPFGLPSPYYKAAFAYNDLRADNISYRRSKLGGYISSSLTQLKQLQYLDLSQNGFGGLPIPEFFGSLANLRYLNLSGSGFGGAIPPQLGNLSSLRCLVIGSNWAVNAGKGLDWISHLSSLEFLDLSWVDLREASNWLQVINMLPALSVLHLSSCSLNPPTPLSLVNLSSLTTLDLSSNLFSYSVFNWLIPSFPPSISSLDLSGNRFSGSVPVSLRNMTSMQSLKLVGNGFNSTIPEWLYHHTSLKALDLSFNNFQGTISKAVGNLSLLEELRLGSNRLVGDIPRSVKNLCRLRDLNLMSNRLVGDVSEYIGYLSSCMKESLEILFMQENQLWGHLPDQLGDFRKLSYLVVSSNFLNGSVPKSLGRLSKLEVLDISNNSLVGTLSESHFANLMMLRDMYASANPCLDFQFNSNWTPPFQLNRIDMSGTMLGPRLPTWLQMQKSLERLVISDARISDPIPTGIFNLPHLSYVDLSNNTIPGSLAPFLCQRLTSKETNLSYLDLSRNLLSGDLPDCWENWKNLRVLKLSKNNFAGEIPRSMHTLVWLQMLHLGGNNLSGILSHSLQNWSRIQVIDLSQNRISGSMPGSLLQHFAELRILVLRSNKLRGILPLELCRLSSLRIVDLANNNLSKTIPKCFGNFSSMIDGEGGTLFFYTLPDSTSFGLTEEVTLVMKNKDREYSSTLQWLTSIDLSCNSLSGEIPKELTNLKGLHGLNLSSNKLHGKMPIRIGNMKWLESLDLSMNQLSGEIPQSIVSLNFLSWLNLSYNHFSGRIPLGSQIQGFSLSFIGNNELCGPPLKNHCIGDYVPNPVVPASDDENENKDEDDDGWIDMKWLYMGIPFGFVVAFWAVLLPLALNKAWRVAYFRFLHDLKNKMFE